MTGRERRGGEESVGGGKEVTGGEWRVRGEEVRWQEGRGEQSYGGRGGGGVTLGEKSGQPSIINTY